MPDDPLQTPFSLSYPTLTHRIVLAPITRMRASPDGIPHPPAAEYYSARTTPGNTSLLITEGMVVHPRGRGFPNTLGLWSEEQIQAWKPITRAVREGGGVFAQLWHVGRISVPSQTGGFSPLSSTRTPLPGNHPLFGETMRRSPARNAIDAGFDGVEIHGGNGYLLDTFVHDNINDRTDAYGGSVENRLRFPLEVVDAVVAAIGKEKAAIRIAPFHVLQQTRDSDRIGTFSRYTEELEKRGLAYVHMVEPRYDQFSTEGAFSSDIEIFDEKVESNEYSLWTFRRILSNTPLIGAGGYDARSARDVLSEGKVDLVALDRHFTSNPDLPRRIYEDLPLTKYERSTFYTSGMRGYLDRGTEDGN